MKRFHVHTGVADLEQSIAFYSELFGDAPQVSKPGYAKWMLDDPRVNFAISARPGMQPGIEHLGIEAETPEELSDIRGKLERSGRPVFAEGEAKCCFAQSTKNWVQDPDGVIWETFHTHGEMTSYGEKLDWRAVAGVSRDAGDEAC